jgi:hypothetical protein
MTKDSQDNSSKKSDTSSSAAPAGDQVKIRWDGSNMRSAYANVFNVTAAREEFVFLFGMNQAFDAGQKELTVQLSDRIVLSPFTAKRMLTVLNNVMQDYESKHGPLDVESPGPIDTSIQ